MHFDRGQWDERRNLLIPTRILDSNKLANYFPVTLYNLTIEIQRKVEGLLYAYISYLFSKITKVPCRFGFIFLFCHLSLNKYLPYYQEIWNY